VRVLVGIVTVVLLLISFASAQELRLYSVEEAVATLCRGEDFLTYGLLVQSIPSSVKNPESRAGIFISTTRIEGQFPRISRIEFSESVHPIARTLVQETFAGFKFDPAGDVFLIEKVCGLPTPISFKTPYEAAVRIGWRPGNGDPVPLLKGKTTSSSINSRGIVPITGWILGPVVMRFPPSVRTVALDVRMVLENGRVGICYQITDVNPLRDVNWIWRQVIVDLAPLKVVDCALARQTPSSSQPSQPSTPDR
jgi:hypothetical protein